MMVMANGFFWVRYTCCWVMSRGRLRHLTGTNERSRMMAASPTSSWSGHWRFGVATKSC